MIRKKITIINKLGLHARAAAKLVDRACRYGSEIQLKRDHQVADAKSILDVMMLAASKGTDLELIINGEDEAEALKDIAALIENRFGEAE